jgi:predicted DNA-binding protein
MSKDRSIFLRVDADLEDRLKVAAKNDRRPFAQYVRNVLEDAVARPLARQEGITP